MIYDNRPEGSSYSTSSKMLKACGKVKAKMPVTSLETIKLLKDCHIKASEIKDMNGVALVNEWSTLINGEKVTFCHSIATTDGKFHFRDYDGNVSTAKTRDKVIDAILADFLERLHRQDNERPDSRETDFITSHLPSAEDFELAYMMLAQLGEDISIDSVLDQIEINLKNEGHLLKSNWRMVTEKNIEIWSK